MLPCLQFNKCSSALRLFQIGLCPALMAGVKPARCRCCSQVCCSPSVKGMCNPVGCSHSDTWVKLRWTTVLSLLTQDLALNWFSFRSVLLKVLKKYFDRDLFPWLKKWLFSFLYSLLFYFISQSTGNYIIVWLCTWIKLWNKIYFRCYMPLCYLNVLFVLVVLVVFQFLFQKQPFTLRAIFSKHTMI